LRAFFTEYFDLKPALLRGPPERAAGLISLHEVVAAVAGDDDPQGRFLSRPEHIVPGAVPSPSFVASLQGGVTQGSEAVWAYIESGHPLVWNGARGATQALDALAEDLAGAFEAHVWPNIYATGEAGTALDMHFDPHEVLAIQCEGRKEWTISAVRVSYPLDLPELKPAIQRALELRRDEAMAETLMTFTVEPGDVVYIPRGQFHNARAVGGRSLHVTFAISPASGVDVVQALRHAALNESLFREYLPPAIADPDGKARRAYLQRLAALIPALVEAATGCPRPAGVPPGEG
jgi:hypothetical protein